MCISKETFAEFQKRFNVHVEEVTDIKATQKEIIAAIGSLKDSRAFAQGSVSTWKMFAAGSFMVLVALGSSLFAVVQHLKTP